MLVRTLGRLRGLLRDDIGQDVMEYALLGSLISVGAIGMLKTTDTAVSSLWNEIAAGIAAIL
jgi:Flp pilus assembly pilin Flp